jgi:D-serine deaminase-like pyridoxal phosphate-dependent protein
MTEKPDVLSVAGLAAQLVDPVLDGLVKGWPDLGCRASEVGGGDLRVDDLGTPALTIREAALSNNIATLADWCASRDVALAPHAKTTMAPRLMERQMAAGAWGLTVANVRQARVALASGARRVVIANEVTVAADLAWICAQGDADILFCVDSLEGLALAESEHRQAGGPPLPVLVEVGYQEGRCGVRSTAEAVELARAIVRSPHVALRGIEGFEGLTNAPDAFLEDLLAGAQAIAPLIDHADPIVTAGGSAYFDLVVDVLGPAASQLGWTLCVRSGCYVTHDHGIYAEAADRRAPNAPRFDAAIEVRASVLSRPQPDRLILDCGRRDVSFDAGLPVVLGHDGLAVVALNDQHAHVRVDGSCDLTGGDVVRLGISHPCTTLDRWQVIALVDDSGCVLEAVPTCF